MNDALANVIEDPVTRTALAQFFRISSAYIIGSEETDITHRELSKRWNKQKELDRLIDSISRERDEDAIELSIQFTCQQSVFIGILARMMQAARKPLIAFVIKSLLKDEDLVNHRFNGKSLLHFAASSSCLPVVRQLLAAGMSPDVLDDGGHTPLYRAAGSRCADASLIITELIRAGTNVNHCGGVSRSTALHEAARHGNLQAARTLLDAGASLMAKDKRGLTPFDRAKNCRRHEVASLLARR